VNESAYRFGEFHLIPAKRELWCANRRVRLQPKVFDTLVYLVQHRDQGIGSDELISAVWGRVDVNDNVLGQIISRARRAVGDSGDAQHSILTIYRFGFRWIRDVEVCPAEVDRVATYADPVPFEAASSNPHRIHAFRHWDRRSIAASALALLCTASFVGWASKEHPVGNTNQHPKMIIAPSASPATAVPGATPLAQLRVALASNQLDVAHKVLRDLPDQDRLVSEIRYEESMLALKEGHFDGALSGFKSLLSDLGDHGDPVIIGKAWYGAGLAENRRGDVDVAQQHYEQAINVLQNSSTRDANLVLGQSWTNLGFLLAACRQLDQAESAYGKARVALEAAGDPAALAALERSVAVLLVGRHRIDEALPRFERAAELAQRSGDALVEARARMNLVNAQFLLLQSADAMASVARLRDLREHIGDPILAANVDLIRARVLTANGRLSEAEVLLRTSASRPTPDDPGLAAFRAAVTADLAFAKGSLEEGSQQVRDMLASSWYSPESGLAAFERWRLLKAQQALGDKHGLMQAATEADAQSRARPKELTVGLYASLSRAEAADTQANPVRARAEFEHALSLAETVRVPYDLVHVVDSYVQFLLRHGEASEAGAMANRLAEWAKRDYAASLVRLDADHAVGGQAWTAALAQTRRLAGERLVPTRLLTPPTASPSLKSPELLAVRGP
jgi:DNA-binding winged helix-turn-helix (wHTH) protein/tetratricopeptide (TPR) repeat protein